MQIKNLPQAKTIEHSRNNSEQNSLEMKPIEMRASQIIQPSVNIKQKG